jgi:hypothetical protein
MPWSGAASREVKDPSTPNLRMTPIERTHPDGKGDIIALLTLL